jgi:hypothetical protein
MPLWILDSNWQIRSELVVRLQLHWDDVILCIPSIYLNTGNMSGDGIKNCLKKRNWWLPKTTRALKCKCTGIT